MSKEWKPKKFRTFHWYRLMKLGLSPVYGPHERNVLHSWCVRPGDRQKIVTREHLSLEFNLG